jgi:hypothetical protein
MRWLVTIASLPLFAYGVLNLVAPALTTRWQRRSTAKHSAGDPRQVVGLAFQRLLGDDASPATEKAVHRRVRLVGCIEVAIAAAAIAFAWTL